MRTKINNIRVKLPKSFLAVNLSESHTFHKKEETEDLPATATTDQDPIETNNGSEYAPTTEALPNTPIV
jgi:hypothetical protein